MVIVLFPLNKEYVEKLLTPYFLTGWDDSSSYGYGLCLGEIEGGRIAFSGGSSRKGRMGMNAA